MVLKSQELAIEAAELRGRLNDLLAKESSDLTDEERADVDGGAGRLSSIEKRRATALTIEAAEGAETRETETAEGDGEEREVAELRSRFRVGNVIAAILGGGRIEGAEAEYAAAVKTPGQIPIKVWDRPVSAPGSAVETRAVTPGMQTGIEAAPIVPALFDRSVAPFLGVAMETAEVGDKSFPVLSTSVTADAKAKAAEAAEMAGAFTVTTVQPRRVTGSFRFAVEDQARMDGLEEALRMNLSMVLSDQVDNQVLNGSGSGDGTVNGLLNILDDPAVPEDDAETWARYNAALASHIDGLFAVDSMGVAGLVGVATYRHMAQQFRANESNESFAAYASRVFGGVRATRRIAAADANVQQAVMRLTNPAGDRAAVMAVWPGLTIRDIYTDADKGEVVVTALALVSDVVVLRSGAYVQDSFRLA